MIELSNLSKRFGKLEAVRRLNLTVPAGELFCFLGPNGAGKTTTIKMATGLMRPDEGAIRIAGLDLAREPVAAKQIIGYIPDMPFLYDRLTPAEFLEFVGDLYGVPAGEVERARAEEFAKFGLLEHQGKLIGDLSHGMRQRVIYVATFLHNPRVLFIDEPLVGLDPYSIRMIKDLLRAKTREGATIFLTTHILAVAEEIADRIGIITHGDLIALGTMPELLARYAGHANLEGIYLKLTADAEE